MVGGGLAKELAKNYVGVPPVEVFLDLPKPRRRGGSKGSKDPTISEVYTYL